MNEERIDQRKEITGLKTYVRERKAEVEKRCKEQEQKK